MRCTRCGREIRADLGDESYECLRCHEKGLCLGCGAGCCVGALVVEQPLCWSCGKEVPKDHDQTACMGAWAAELETLTSAAKKVPF